MMVRGVNLEVENFQYSGRLAFVRIYQCSYHVIYGFIMSCRVQGYSRTDGRTDGKKYLTRSSP